MDGMATNAVQTHADLSKQETRRCRFCMLARVATEVFAICFAARKWVQVSVSVCLSVGVCLSLRVARYRYGCVLGTNLDI